MAKLKQMDAVKIDFDGWLKKNDEERMDANHPYFQETRPECVRRHLSRYRQAANILDDLEACTVIDAPCGTGYGSEILAGKDRYVLGVDADGTAVEYAREKYSCAGRAVYMRQRIEALLIPPHFFVTSKKPPQYEVVVCIEGIEHTSNENTSKWLKTFYNIGAQYLIMAYPENGKSNLSEGGFHVIETDIARVACWLNWNGWRLDNYWLQDRQSFVYFSLKDLIDKKLRLIDFEMPSAMILAERM